MAFARNRVVITRYKNTPRPPEINLNLGTAYVNLSNLTESWRCSFVTFSYLYYCTKQYLPNEEIRKTTRVVDVGTRSMRANVKVGGTPALPALVD